jgi:hypothetical protein
MSQRGPYQKRLEELWPQWKQRLPDLGRGQACTRRLQAEVRRLARVLDHGLPLNADARSREWWFWQYYEWRAEALLKELYPLEAQVMRERLEAAKAFFPAASRGACPAGDD